MVLPDIPLGVLRKILILRNSSEKTKKMLTLPESKWKCEDVETFVRQTLKGKKETIDKICNFIHEKSIDGVVLFSYSNFKDIQKDFSSSQEYGLQFEKIILRKEEILECFRNSEIRDSQTVLRSCLKKQGLSKPFHDVAKFVPFFQDRLKLDNITEKQNTPFKSLNLSIIYSAWKSKNELESKVQFLILCENSDQLDAETQRNIWSKIRHNLRVWRQYFDAPSQALFVESDDSECLSYNGDLISLSNEQPQIKPIMEKFKKPQDLSSIANSFLFVDCNTFDPDVPKYEINLQIPGEEPVLYRFNFRMGVKYWQFDHKNAAKGFWLSTLITGDTEIEQNQILDTVPYTLQTQSHRNFLGSGEDIQYFTGKIFPTCESGGTLADRCFEYKYFATSLKTTDKAISKFLIETLRFACGVLNSRKNGTIAFGIGDDVGKIDGRSFKHGEIVGFGIQEMDKDFKSKFTDALDDAKKKSFDDASKDKAIMCIGDPVFIPVVTSGSERVLYVMEVDIEPSTNKCESAHFKLNRSKLDNLGNIKKLEKDFTVYFRKGSSTEKIDEEIFVHKFLDKYVMERKIFDELTRKKMVTPLELPMNKLHRLLCNGLDYFDSSFYPFIVLGKPTVEQKQNPEWIKNLQFIRTIDFYCVFDFDDYSNIDGLCCKYLNKNKCEIFNEVIFEDFSNPVGFTKLQSLLGYPQDLKTVWLFSNGKYDSSPVRPHVDRKTWSTEYLGVRDAVSFYCQNIKKQRAMVLFCLFSNDFVGIIEILYECIDRFGWDRIIIITPEQNILQDFKKILEREEKCSEEDIIRRSIHGGGATWEHVCSTICMATGQEEEISIRIPAYSGGEGVPMDHHFKDAINDLDVLSTMLCNSSFKQEDEIVNLKVEKQFYKGGKVNWFNFALGHVCTRYIFTQVKEYIERVLIYGHENNDQIAYTVTINYQPGAGVSTLGRHLLWEFHERFRCAVVKRLTNNTISNIFSLWQYKEPSKRNPILLLVDELSDPDFYPQQVVKKLQKHYDIHKFPRDGPVCCLIICEQGVNDADCNPPFTNTVIDYSVTLRHKLTENEKTWFNVKFKQIENRKHAYRPDNLISFLILRTDFDSTYIKNTITELLNTIEGDSKEFDLLSFVALFSYYANRSFNSKRTGIPVECCDEFIGTKYSKNKAWEGWEKTLSDDKRIFLITEENRYYSTDFKFKEIRISHPSIAPEVIKCLNERGLPLSKLTLNFLNSSILMNGSVKAENIIECKTKEMLKRRLKEEYNDMENTAYSPVIERIIKEEGWQAAKSVLEKGIELFQDCYMYQTISKLLSNNKQHDDAIYWAKESKKYASSIEERGFCYQSLGLALKNKFESNMNNYTDIDKSAYEFESLLYSLELLVKARECVETIGEISVLYCTHYIVQIILLCGKFIMEKANFPKEIDRKKLLNTICYDPPELPETWKEIRKRFSEQHSNKTNNSLFSMFVTEGRYSFGLIQKMICFEPIYYSHSPQILHRLHRLLSRPDHYPKLLNTFIKLFGEEGEEPPPDAPPSVLDEWHRGKVLKIMGNNYMDLFNSVYQQYCKRETTLEKALSLCMDIQGYLVLVKQKEPYDLINLVAVNFVLSFLKRSYSKRIPTIITIKDLIGFCDLASKTHGEYVDQAFFFLSMLLWPSAKEDTNYDNGLFNRTLNHFVKRKPKYIQRKKEQRDMRGENNFRKASPQFFLGNGKHLNKVCHRFDIYKKNSSNEKFDDGNLWKRLQVQRTVKRLEGYIQYNQSLRQYISVTNEISGDEIKIRQIRKCCIKSEEGVTFVLGFSIAGPMAYDVLSTNPSSDAEKNDIDDEKSETELLDRIEILNSEKGSENLARDEVFTNSCIVITQVLRK